MPNTQILSLQTGEVLRIYRYHLNGTYLGYMTLPGAPVRVQGIAFDTDWDEMLISCIDSPVLRVYSSDGATYRRVMDTAFAANAGGMEGVCYCNGRIYLCYDVGAPTLRIYNYDAHQSVTGLTVWAWVKPSNVTGEHTILSRYAYASGLRHYNLEFVGVNVLFRECYSGSSASFALGEFSPAIGTWYLMIGVYDAAAGTIMVGCGALGGALNFTAPAAAANGLFAQSIKTSIGAFLPTDDSATGSYPFAGNIAQVGVLDRALSTAETDAIFARGIYG